MHSWILSQALISEPWNKKQELHCRRKISRSVLHCMYILVVGSHWYFRNRYNCCRKHGRNSDRQDTALADDDAAADVFAVYCCHHWWSAMNVLGKTENFSLGIALEHDWSVVRLVERMSHTTYYSVLWVSLKIIPVQLMNEQATHHHLATKPTWHITSRFLMSSLAIGLERDVFLAQGSVWFHFIVGGDAILRFFFVQSMILMIDVIVGAARCIGYLGFVLLIENVEEKLNSSVGLSSTFHLLGNIGIQEPRTLQRKLDTL